MSNIHSKQTGTQLHSPKRYKETTTDTILSKLDDDYVKWLGGNREVRLTLTPVADSGGNLNNKYFYIWTKNNTKKLAVWFNVNGAGSFTAPDGCDGLIEVPIATDEVVALIIDKLKTAIEGASVSSHITYTTSTDNTTTYTYYNQCCNSVVDYNTGFDFSQGVVNVSQDEVLISKASSGILEFTPLAEKIADVVGTMVSDNTETNISVTYDDADNTLDFEVTGGSGITIQEEGVSLTTAASTLNFVGASVTASGDGATKTITITNDPPEGTSIRSTGEETTTKFLRTDGDGTCSWQSVSSDETKKDKDDVEDVIGVTGTNLGTFTGGTIGDSRDIKVALQDLETKLETDATTSVKGVSSYDSDDFSVSSGAVSLNKRIQYIHTRFSASNLDVNATKVGGSGDDLWLMPETNNNKDLVFTAAVDADNLLYEKALRSSLITPLDSETWKLVGGKCIASGESGTSYEIVFYNADLDGETAKTTLVAMANFEINGTANATMSHDFDVRGAVTLKFEVY